MKSLSFLVCCAVAALSLASSAHAQNKTKVKSINVPSLNGEICLGDTLRPRVTVSNVSTGAVNIRVLVKITNAVTNLDIYAAETDLLNIASGKDAVVSLATLATNPNMLSQLGRHNVVTIASALVGGVVTPDSNPADDTLRTLLFGLRRFATPFRETSNDYSMIGSVAIPQQYWVSRGATVVDGDAVTFDPPHPRDPGAGYGPLHLHSPVIKLDRRSFSGQMYSGVTSGDTLTSVPLNLEGQTRVALSFDYHRSSKQLYSWQYDKDTLRGCESTILNSLGNTVRPGDSLILEFKKPAEPACEPSSNGWTQIAAIDGAKDFEFHRFYLKVESKNTSSVNYFTKDFRFRLRLKAKADASSWAGQNAIDDEDAWYIDNIQVYSPRRSEYGIDWVRVVTPYTKVPASQASLPVYLKINNKGLSTQAVLPFIVQITGQDGQTKYWQRQSTRLPVGGTDTVIRFPDWDASNTMVTLGRECTVKAWCADPSWDALGWEEDNEAYSKFYLNVESASNLLQEFAYDDGGVTPGLHSGNDFPVLFSLQGRGAGFNNTTGSYAMRFKLGRRDSLYGARIYFGRANAGPDAIRISVLDGSPQSATPGALVSADATMQREREGNQFDQFWTYYFPKPIVLPGEANGDDGIYWLSVSQLGLDNIQLGADISRTGGDYRVQDPFTPVIQFVHRDRYATQYGATHNAGDISQAFAQEITAGSGNWRRLEPSPSFGAAFIPMIRPLLGRQTLLPVEFAKPLEARDHRNSALLTWTTATESNNHGFVIERLGANDEWQRLGFVLSYSPSSSTPKSYSYVDEGLSTGTYTYRLTQRDLDGTESVSNTAEVSITGESIAHFSPNPFDPSVGVTALSLDASVGEVTVSIINSLGQQVRSMTASNRIAWDGKDDLGNVVGSGSYLIRLKGNSIDDTRRVTVVK